MESLVSPPRRGSASELVFGLVYTDLIREEMWAIVKEARNPIIDFGSLNRFTIERTKELAADLFGGMTAAVSAEVSA